MKKNLAVAHQGGLGDRVVELEHALAKATGFGGAKRVRLYNKLGRFAERGRNVKDALEAMRSRFEQAKDPRRLVLRRWITEMNNGRPLSQAVAGYLPSTERMMIAAGESNGDIATGFKSAEFVANAGRRIQGALIGALAYPAVLLVILVMLLYVAAYKLVPIMTGLMAVDRWPPMARNFHHFTSVIQHYGLYMAIAGLAGSVLVMKTLPTWKGPLREALDRRMPPWSIYREMQSASVLIAISAIVKAGRPVDEALEMMRRVTGPWLKVHLDRFLKGLRSGRMPGVAANTGLFAKEVVGDLEDYSAAGAFEAAIEDIGLYVVEDTIARIGAQARVLNGLILCTVAATLLWMYASMTTLGLTIQAAAKSGGL